MSARRIIFFGVSCAFGLVLSGCDGGGISEGVPEKVDMTKTYTPDAALPKMTPKDMMKSRAADAKNAAEDAKNPPAEAPK